VQKWIRVSTKAIAPFDAYIIVYLEYNFGIPASMKNAIDYVYNDRIGNPNLIVTYGIQGVKRASAQLGTILNGMKLRVVETKPQLACRKDEQMMHVGKGGVYNPNVHTKHYQTVILG
jgi:NAD(P)H-dependent FMN reductase